MCCEALEAIKLLTEHSSALKIQRAQMRLKLSVPGMSLSLSVCLSLCLSLSVCVSVCLSVCLLVGMSLYLSPSIKLNTLCFTLFCGYCFASEHFSVQICLLLSSFLFCLSSLVLVWNVAQSSLYIVISLSIIRVTWYASIINVAQCNMMRRTSRHTFVTHFCLNTFLKVVNYQFEYAGKAECGMR